MKLSPAGRRMGCNETDIRMVAPAIFLNRLSLRYQLI
jgi:hypothetical protein